MPGSLAKGVLGVYFPSCNKEGQRRYVSPCVHMYPFARSLFNSWGQSSTGSRTSRLRHVNFEADNLVQRVELADSNNS